MFLRVVFIKLTFKWLQTGLSDLKNTNWAVFGVLVPNFGTWAYISCECVR